MKLLIKVILTVLLLLNFNHCVCSEEEKENSIVIGEATIKVKPDRAYIDVVVSAKAGAIDTVVYNIKDKITTLERDLAGYVLTKEIPKITVRKYTISPLINKRPIGFKKVSESMTDDFNPISNDYIKEGNPTKGVNVFRKDYIYEWLGNQEFAIIIEDTSDINKIEQLVLKLLTMNEDIVPNKYSSSNIFEPGVYDGLVKYGFKPETNEKIRAEVVYKAFEKASEKAKTFAKKLNLTTPFLNGAIVFEEDVYYGDMLVEGGFIPVFARVKLKYYSQ